MFISHKTERKNSETSLSKDSKGEKDQAQNFLQKLYQILENNEYSSIIHWNETGDYFVIENLNLFIEKILPLHYKHNNYSSFVRQLNMYDFHKKRNKENKNIFEHKIFKRGKEELIGSIKRKSKIKELKTIKPQETIFDSTKKINKKTLDKNLAILLQQTNKTFEYQNTLEKSINKLTEESEKLIEDNKKILEEIESKTQYQEKLESIIMFILDLITKSPQLPIQKQAKALAPYDDKTKVSSENVNSKAKSKDIFDKCIEAFNEQTKKDSTISTVEDNANFEVGDEEKSMKGNDDFLCHDDNLKSVNESFFDNYNISE